jgi:hypothetical protein
MSRTHVFLVGAPRSGPSILLDLLTAQPEFSYVTTAVEKDPANLSPSGKTRMYDVPLLGDFWFERRYWKTKLPAPSEAPDFWEYYLPPFRYRHEEPCLHTGDDLDEKDIVRCREAVEEIQDLQKRDLFLGQYAGPARVKMLRKVFPEAKFIQMQRDPRSVSIHLSMRMQEGRSANTLWEHREAWQALMPDELKNRLEDLPDTPLNFAGVMVRWWQVQYRTELAELPESDRFSLAYADLLAKPDATLARALKFLGLKPAKRLTRYVTYHNVRHSNKRLSKNLPEDQAAQLERAIKKLD